MERPSLNSVFNLMIGMTVTRLAVLSTGLLIGMNATAQENGYALECTSIDSTQTHLLSFLESGVDKRVRFIETSTRAMWDTHEWQDNTVTIKSFVQPNGEDQPTLVSYFQIDMSDMSAVLVREGESAEPLNLSCARWSPRVRNR